MGYKIVLVVLIVLFLPLLAKTYVSGRMSHVGHFANETTKVIIMDGNTAKLTPRGGNHFTTIGSCDELCSGNVSFPSLSTEKEQQAYVQKYSECNQEAKSFCGLSNRWVNLYENMYYDNKTIKCNGKTIRVWLAQCYACGKQQTYMEKQIILMKQFRFINIKKRTFLVETQSLYDTNNNYVGTGMGIHFGDRTQVIEPDSLDETILIFLTKLPFSPCKSNKM